MYVFIKLKKCAIIWKNSVRFYNIPPLLLLVIMNDFNSISLTSLVPALGSSITPSFIAFIPHVGWLQIDAILQCITLPIRAYLLNLRLCFSVSLMSNPNPLLTYRKQNKSQKNLLLHFTNDKSKPFINFKKAQKLCSK